ncbi:FapA family protein [Heliophilum fasciatum]|uniref:Flagellar Assembly Protein A N-terminal region domain-containing protein n=1 Tax=Heliophilum fasciatum TaxID=35700 RepID=A0A4R2RN89_9FIRM|nr:FapA family protein [Heliophilum fasciatum]MCW2277916.1 uncharacterized protein (DUF342 family) [Heliophilum fasciatum]TCP64514.1 hypothetical protein EDD73_10955 [Heliophilum fasciatum]
MVTSNGLFKSEGNLSNDSRETVQEVHNNELPEQTELPEDVPAYQEGKVTVQIDRDGMHAYVIVLGAGSANDATKNVDPSIVQEALQKNGVIFGIIDGAIEKAVQPLNFGQKITVAKGIPPQPGTDAQLNYCFDPDQRIKLTELEDGRVDYYNLSLIKNVQVGDILMIRVPPTSGTPGTTVMGHEVKPKAGKDRRIPAGKNTILSEDGKLLTATVAGHVHIAGGRVHIDPVFEWPGDVDFSSGNLSFLGSIIVRGNISYGFKVECAGNLEVFGSIDGGSVDIGGNLTVRQGIQGQQRSLLKVKGNIAAHFIENCTVQADGDIVVGEGIIHSQVDAGGKIHVGGKKSVIVGGRVRAVEEIEAKIIGSPHATVTEIEVGIRPERREYFQELLNREKLNASKVEQTEKTIALLKDWEKKQGRLSPDKRQILLRLTRSQFQLLKEADDLMKEKAQIEKEFEQVAHGKVCAHTIIYPGVMIRIGTASMRVRDNIRASTVVIRDGLLEVIP